MLIFHTDISMYVENPFGETLGKRNELSLRQVFIGNDVSMTSLAFSLTVLRISLSSNLIPKDI